MKCTGVSSTLAEATIAVLEKSGSVALDGAVRLDDTEQSVAESLDKELGDDESYQEKKEEIIAAILESRYKNLYSLLGDNVSDETLLGIVRNKILCDVQGDNVYVGLDELILALFMIFLTMLEQSVSNFHLQYSATRATRGSPLL